MPDERYRDSNGVNWILHPPAAGETRWWSEVVPGEVRHYDPEPPGSIQGTRAALLSDVQAYAKAHESEVVLDVTAKPDSGALFLLLLFVLAIADNK